MIKYRLTDVGINNLDNYNWIKNHFSLDKKGDFDGREIVRLLENPRYNHITKTLEMINDYGNVSGRIVKDIFTCNDPFNLTRLLAELSLFKHIYNIVGNNVIAIDPESNDRSADLFVQNDEMELYIEVYTPMDFYGFQYFDRLISSEIKNLDIDIGFKLNINQDADSLFYAYDFPQHKEVDEWLTIFKTELLAWLKSAKKSDCKTFQGPKNRIKIIIEIEKLYSNPEQRIIIGGAPTRSTDTITYFRIEDPEKFADSEWGWKIDDKLKKQQAGKQNTNILRTLIINLSSSDTVDLTFLNDGQYIDKIDRNIKYIAKKIEPYPPYDIVIFAELGFDCGFGSPIMLSKDSNQTIQNILSDVGLTKMIRLIPTASVEETEAAWKEIMKYSNNFEEDK